MGNCNFVKGHHHHQTPTDTDHSLQQVPQVYSEIHPDVNTEPEDDFKSFFKCSDLILEYFNLLETPVKRIPDELIRQFMQNCKKYGGQHHLHYSTVRDFSAEKLPLCFQALTQLIKVISGQTCRILASSVSTQRPVGDQYSKFRGKCSPRVGSGFVHINNLDVKEMPNVSDNTQHLFDLKTPIYGPFVVQTARHLIYDESEMKSTTTNISFYFDLLDENLEIELIPLKIVGVCGDRIDIECVTYDERLGTLLKELKQDRDKLWQKFVNKPVEDEHKDKMIAVCISHIHGNYSKYISVGECHVLPKSFAPGENAVWRYFQYDAATCAGSSGAPVWICRQDGSSYACVPHSYYDNNVKECASFSAVGAQVAYPLTCPQSENKPQKQVKF